MNLKKKTKVIYDFSINVYTSDIKLTFDGIYLDQ